MTDDNGNWGVNHFYLANGKPLHKDNIDIQTLTNLNNVQRAFSFAGVPPSVNMTVTEHSFLTYLLAGRFRAMFADQDVINRSDWSPILAFCMAHDLSEALVGDIPTPLKHPAFKEFEEEVQKDVLEFLGMDPNEYAMAYSYVFIFDMVASLYECAYSTSKGYDLMNIAEKRLERLFEKATYVASWYGDDSLRGRRPQICKWENGSFYIDKIALEDYICSVMGGLSGYMTPLFERMKK